MKLTITVEVGGNDPVGDADRCLVAMRHAVQRPDDLGRYEAGPVASAINRGAAVGRSNPGRVETAVGPLNYTLEFGLAPTNDDVRFDARFVPTAIVPPTGWKVASVAGRTATFEPDADVFAALRP